jgi:hypothetical protein
LHFKRLVVAFSIERMLIVYFPLFQYRLNTQRNRKICVFSLALFALGFYSFTAYCAEIETLFASKKCTMPDKWMSIMEHFIFIDVFLSILVPFFIMIFFNFLICVGLLEKYFYFNWKKSRIKRLIVVGAASSSATNHTIRRVSLLLVRKLNAKSLKKRKRDSFRTTRMLLGVTSVILLLNFPIVYTKLSSLFYDLFEQEKEIDYVTRNMESSIQDYDFLANGKNFTKSSLLRKHFLNKIIGHEKEDEFYSKNNQTASLEIQPSYKRKDENEIYSNSNEQNDADLFLSDFEIRSRIIDHLACWLFYLNYSLNFLLYTFNSKKFKNTFLKIF